MQSNHLQAPLYNLTGDTSSQYRSCYALKIIFSSNLTGSMDMHTPENTTGETNTVHVYIIGKRRLQSKIVI
jgi:hypothetical protein